MMLILLLTELTRLGVHLSSTPDGLQVEAPAGVLTEELRQAMATHKAALLRFACFPLVETIDGLGRLSGSRQAQDCTWVAPERWERLRYKIGVASLSDDLERFYYPCMVLLPRPETPQMDARASLS